MVGGSSSASSGRRSRPHGTAHTTPVTYYRLFSLCVTSVFLLCVRCREMSRKKKSSSQKPVGKRIFFLHPSSYRIQKTRKKRCHKKFSPLFVQPGVSFASSQGLINRCRCYFFLCVCVFVCVNLSNHLRPVLGRREKKKVHSFILQTSAGIGYNNTFCTVF